MSPILSTLYHVLELVVVIIVGWTICKLFNLQDDDVKLVVSLVLAAFVKYARASDASSIPDYVNGPQTPALK